MNMFNIFNAIPRIFPSLVVSILAVPHFASAQKSDAGIGTYVLEKTKEKQLSPAELLKKAKCPDAKYCRLKPSEIAAFMQALDELGREEGPLVQRNFIRLRVGKQNYDQIVRRRLGVTDLELQLTPRQITRTLGEALEAEEIQHSPFMADIKLHAPDWYEAFDRRFEKIRPRR